MSRRILITGGAGFIGSNLIDYLNFHSPEWDIQALDDLSTGLSSNLDGSRCNLVVGSILDADLLSEVAAGVDHIVHLAAIGSVPRSVSSPRPTHEANATGTLNVLEMARKNSIDHVIVASSSSVYGSNPKLPRSEFDWTRPLSPYAVSKQATEAYASAFASSYGMKTVAFRFFNVFGPRQRSDHPYAAVIPKFISAALSRDPITIHGDGMQTRDFTFVESVCEAIHVSLKNVHHFEHPVNLAFGTKMSVLDIVAKLEGLLGRNLEVRHTETRVGDVSASQAETTYLRELLPSLTEIDFEAGLRRTIEWFVNDAQSAE